MPRKVAISDTLRTTALPIFYVSRILGLAPLSLAKIGPNWVLQRSPKLTAYSLILGVTLGCLAVNGLINDLNVDVVRSIRMKNRTSKYVTCVDISVVILIVLTGIFGATLRLTHFWTIVTYVSEVDKALTIKNPTKIRNLTVAAITLGLVLACALLGTDFYSWFILAQDSDSTEFFSKNYVPFYLLYVIAFHMEFQYCHVIVSVKRRIKAVNDCLGSLRNGRNLKIFFRDSPKNGSKSVDLISTERNEINLRGALSAECVKKIVKIHEDLCEAVVGINEYFGLSVLIIILSCTLHLIVTPYFLFLEVVGRQSKLFVAIQLVWILAHFVRLMLIIEPCYASLKEARSTSPLVCKLLLCADISDALRKQLKMFSTQLLHRDVRFTACGMAILDRPLVAGIAGAVTTYLVILIQLHNSNN